MAPKRRAETESIPDAQLAEHLAKNPKHVRRPIIDTGTVVTAGFTAQTRAQLEAAKKKR